MIKIDCLECGDGWQPGFRQLLTRYAKKEEASLCLTDDSNTMILKQSNTIIMIIITPRDITMDWVINVKAYLDIVKNFDFVKSLLTTIMNSDVGVAMKIREQF